MNDRPAKLTGTCQCGHYDYLHHVGRNPLGIRTVTCEHCDCDDYVDQGPWGQSKRG